MVEEEFQLYPLTKLKYYFSDAEHKQIVKYGNWAKSLDEGLVLPDSDRQDHFASVCKGLVEPETGFELLWLRYRLIVQADLRVVELENLLDEERSQAKWLRKSLFDEVEKGKIEAGRQAELIKKLQVKLIGYERKLGLSPLREPEIPDTSKARKICPNCGGDGGAAGQCYRCDGSGWIFV